MKGYDHVSLLPSSVIVGLDEGLHLQAMSLIGCCQQSSLQGGSSDPKEALAHRVWMILESSTLNPTSSQHRTSSEGITCESVTYLMPGRRASVRFWTFGTAQFWL